MIYLIGIPGLIPFYLCFYNIDLIFLDFDKDMFVYYSAVIMSFLGAVYWGVYLQSKNNIAIFLDDVFVSNCTEFNISKLALSEVGLLL
mgnify:CR=1 FL=1